MIYVLIDLAADHSHHAATMNAIRDASKHLGLTPEVQAVRTDAVGDVDHVVRRGNGVVIGPGSPYRDKDAACAVIRAARERGVPLVGTWGGFQHVLVEHARNLAGVADATHAEYGDAGTPVITLLACSLQDQSITVKLTPGSRLAGIYAGELATERTTCSYGLSPSLERIASEHGMRVAAVDDTGEVRAVERIDHPFFVGTLYQPQLSSTASRPHPVFLGLLAAVAAMPDSPD